MPMDPSEGTYILTEDDILKLYENIKMVTIM